MYNEKVFEHFRNPRNFGQIKNPDGIGKAGNLRCGDVMHIFIKIKNDKIAEIKFKTLGCAAAIATSSMLTDLTKGKTIAEALKIKEQGIVEGLGGLPPIKIHCSLLAVKALKEAIYDYLSKNKKEIPAELEEAHQRAKKEVEVAEEKCQFLTKKQLSKKF